MRDIVSFQLMESVKEVVMTDSYLFIPKGRFRWLQKLLWKYLHKFDCLESYFAKTSKVQRIDVNFNDLFKSISKAINNYRYFYGEAPSEIIIGPEEMDEFLYGDISQLSQVMTIENKDRRFMGIKIRIVPHMKGVLVL